jgi:hypothetical protein
MSFAAAARTLLARERTCGRLFLLGMGEADELQHLGNFDARFAGAPKVRPWSAQGKSGVSRTQPWVNEKIDIKSPNGATWLFEPAMMPQLSP